MSRLFRIILIIGCLYPSLSRSQFLSDWSGPAVQKHNLKGQVKLITQVQSPIKNTKGDWLDGPSGQNYSEEYTREGFLLKRVSHDDYIKPTTAAHYEYNSKGQIISFWEETLESNPSWGPMGGRIDYEYDQKKYGYSMRDKRIIMGKPMNRRIETSIDSMSRIAIQREYKQDTLLVREQRRKWDLHGNRTEDASRYCNQPDERINLRDTSLNNFLRSEFNIELSQAEKKLAERFVDSLMHKKESPQKIRPEWTGDTTNYKNDYDSQATLVRQETYTNNQMTQVESYSYNQGSTKVLWQSYDNKGNLISESTGHKDLGSRYTIVDSSRHKSGSKWEERTSASSASYTQPIYQFKYDDHGNWTEQKQVDANGNQIGVALLRTIEYYP